MISTSEIANTLVALANKDDPTDFNEFVSSNDEICDHDVRLALLDLANKDDPSNMKRFLENYNKPSRLLIKNMLELALVVACRCDNIAMAQCILQWEKCSEFLYTTDQVMCPLGYAVCNHNMDLLRLLVEHKVFPSHLSKTQNTRYPPLTLAAYMGYLDMVQYLVENGVMDSLTVDLPIMNAMEAAAEMNHVHVVKYFYEHHSKWFSLSDVLLHACNCGSMDVVSYIHSLDPKLIHKPGHMYSEPPILVATRSNQFRVVRWLLEQKVPVDDKIQDRTITDYAIMAHQWDMVDFLLKQGGTFQYKVHSLNDLDLLLHHVPGVSIPAKCLQCPKYHSVWDELYNQIRGVPLNQSFIRRFKDMSQLDQATFLRYVCEMKDYEHVIGLIEEGKADVYYTINDMNFVEFVIFRVHEPIVRYLCQQNDPPIKIPQESVQQALILRSDIRLLDRIYIDRIVRDRKFPWLSVKQD